MRDLTWRDLELVVEREKRPPYDHLVDGVLPLVYGILLGFVGALLVGALVLFLGFRMSQADGTGLLQICHKTRAKARRQRRPGPANFSCDLTSSESDTAPSSTIPPRPRRRSTGICGFFPGCSFLWRVLGLVRQKPRQA